MTDQTKIEYGTDWAKVHGLPEPGNGYGQAHLEDGMIEVYGDGYEVEPVMLDADGAEAFAAWILAAAHKTRGQR